MRVWRHEGMEVWVYGGELMEECGWRHEGMEVN